MLLTMCGVTMVLVHDLDFALAFADSRSSLGTPPDAISPEVSAPVSASGGLISTVAPVLVPVLVSVATSPSSTLASALASALALAVPSPISTPTEASDEDCGFNPAALADPSAAASAD